MAVGRQEERGAGALGRGALRLRRGDGAVVLLLRDILLRDRKLLGLATVDLSELAKAEGAVTCCSIILSA